MRYLKIIAALFIGLLGLLAFLNNLFNIASAQSFVSAVLSAPEQPWYQVFGPTLGAPWHGWLGLAVIMAGELAAGLLGFAGAARMWQDRATPADGFQRAKTLAVAGDGLSVEASGALNIDGLRNDSPRLASEGLEFALGLARAE